MEDKTKLSKDDHKLSFNDDSDYRDSDDCNPGGVFQWLGGACFSVFNGSLSVGVSCFPHILSFLSNINVLGSKSSLDQNIDFPFKNFSEISTLSKSLCATENDSKMVNPDSKENTINQKTDKKNYKTLVN